MYIKVRTITRRSHLITLSKETESTVQNLAYGLHLHRDDVIFCAFEHGMLELERQLKEKEGKFK